MINTDKKVSVIMGIYNCENTLSEAIESILNQTYDNWELIICDDASTDNTFSVAMEYKTKYPKKFIIINNDKNLGLNKTLNRCLEYANGEYIARMDGDDISLSDRFEKEVSFLNSNPDFSIVSGPMIYFDENGDWGQGTAIAYPKNKDFLNGTPFCHAPCMVRAEAYRTVNGYSENHMTLRAEDYDLWFRMYELGFKGHNLSEPIYKMRDDANAYSRRKFKFAINEAYVRFTGYKRLKLPVLSYIYALRPIIVGLLPKPIYMKLHHKNKCKY